MISVYILGFESGSVIGVFSSVKKAKDAVVINDPDTKWNVDNVGGIQHYNGQGICTNYFISPFSLDMEDNKGAWVMNERLEQIKARVEKTTSGPWEWYDTGIITEGGRDVLWFEWSSEYDPNGYTGVCEDDDVENMEFIENAREDIPWLLEQLEALQAAAGLIPCAGCHRLYTHKEHAVMLEKYGMFVCECGQDDNTKMKRQYTLKERLEMRENK